MIDSLLATNAGEKQMIVCGHLRFSAAKSHDSLDRHRPSERKQNPFILELLEFLTGEHVEARRLAAGMS